MKKEVAPPKIEAISVKIDNPPSSIVKAAPKKIAVIEKKAIVQEAPKVNTTQKAIAAPVAAPKAVAAPQVKKVEAPAKNATQKAVVV